MEEMHQSSDVAAIILAAGKGQRMEQGHQKLLLPLGDRPIVAHVLFAVYHAKVTSIIVVLGHNAPLMRKEISSHIPACNIIYVENPDYHTGMSSSLHTGIRTLMLVDKSASYQCALILLGDQPLVSSALVNQLIAARQTTGKRIIVPRYKGKRGNPVLFDRRLWPELLMVTGDEGGKRVIEKYHMEVAGIEIEDEIINDDIDTWESYQKMVKVWG